MTKKDLKELEERTKKQNESNKARSTGSRASLDSRDLGDPVEDARQYFDAMDEAYRSKPADQIEGQETLPGFETPEEQPAQLDTETIKKNMGKVSFKVDYLISPEDALIKHHAPSSMLVEYLRKHLDEIVNTAAKLTGADPEQLRDKDKRTPEQQQLLYEIAGKMETARMEKFFSSLYVKATDLLLSEEYQYITLHSPDPGETLDEYIDRIHSEYGEAVVLQAVLYFFALHKEINPVKPGEFTDQQKQELKDIFHKLDDFYCDYETETEETLPYDNLDKIFLQFIEKENPTEGAAQTIADIPVVQAIIAENYIIPNHAIANALQQKHIIESPENAQGWDLVVSNAKGKRKEITSYTMVTYDSGTSDVTITDLTRHERAVSNSIVSLWVEAEEKGKRPIFTDDQIFRAMPGGGDKASPQQKGAIKKAIDKFTRLRIYVNATEEMQKRGIIKPGGKYIFDEYFLNVRRHIIKTENGGKTVQAYEILSQPVIYTYSKLVNQIISIPAKYTEIRRVTKNPATGALSLTGEVLSMTISRQAMTEYLLQRIAIMKNDLKRAKEELRSYKNRRKKNEDLEEKTLDDFRQQSDIISFDTIFADAGLSDQDKITAKRNRDFIFDVLDYQKVSGNIKDYEKQTKGQKITGIKIIL